MAAGPASGSAFASPAHPGYQARSLDSRELLAAAADNLWASSLVATASTGHAGWADHVHSASTDEIQPNNPDSLRRIFHQGRTLLLKHLPRDTTEEEIRELLSEWDVYSVSLHSGSARVSLTSPAMLEDWDSSAVLTLRGQRIVAVPAPTEMLLCVARLPSSTSETDFLRLVNGYGEVRRAWLMRSPVSAHSKGYGFVEYVGKEAALQAKNGLEGSRAVGGPLVCDWLDSQHTTLRSLHSKCLYVDRLPPNYRDMGEFRRIFSVFVNPPYCQIALKNGAPQDWGLVEFTGEEEAERTQAALDGFPLHGHRLRVAFVVPGLRAINLYLRLLNDSSGGNKGKSALLPDPPAPAVFQQLQSLAKQNPVFAQNLQTIILQQIQESQKMGLLSPPSQPPLANTNHHNALLAAALQQHQQQHQHQLHQQQQQQQQHQHLDWMTNSTRKGSSPLMGLEVAMDTTGPPPSRSQQTSEDPLQAVFYTLFGQPAQTHTQTENSSTTPLSLFGHLRHTDTTYSQPTTQQSQSQPLSHQLNLNLNTSHQQHNSSPPGFSAHQTTQSQSEAEQREHSLLYGHQLQQGQGQVRCYSASELEEAISGMLLRSGGLDISSSALMELLLESVSTTGQLGWNGETEPNCLVDWEGSGLKRKVVGLGELGQVLGGGEGTNMNNNYYEAYYKKKRKSQT